MEPQSPQPWPHFLSLLRPRLEQLQMPKGSFNPAGAWEHHYAVLVIGNLLGAANGRPYPYGTLRLKRSPTENGLIRINIDLDAAAVTSSGLCTTASIICSENRLATPQRWELHSQVKKKGELIAETTVSETGEVRDGAIVRRGKIERKIQAPARFTSNWTLLEAVQRLPFEGMEPLNFDVFEDMDLHKPEQRLMAVGASTVDLGGRPVRLHCFRQLGRGILPMHYWLDDQHRLIATTGGLRAIIWSTGGKAPEKEPGKP